MSGYPSARVYALLLPLTVALLGCNSSSSSTPSIPSPTDSTAPTVSSTSPVDGATDVATSSAVTATFDEDIFAATVDGASFTLLGNGNVTGTVSFDGATNTATFTPDTNLGLLTTYTATLTTAITDLSGNPLGSNVTWNFITADGTWSAAELIEPNGGDAYAPQIAIDANGNALAVWMQSDGARYSIWSNRYEADTGWGTAELIETDNAGDAQNPEIAVDANGNALAVWFQSDGTQYSIVSNRYEAGTGWGTPELVEMSNEYAIYPQIAFDASGNALVVWEQNDGTRYNIWSNRYAAGTGWGTEELIETDANHATAAQIAVDADGNALALWLQFDGARYNVASNRYAAGTGWGTEELIETENAGNAEKPQIAVDANGNAVAVWDQSDGTRNNIWSNRYEAGTGWGTAELLETDNAGGADTPQVAFDANGNALAVWHQHDGTRYNVTSKRYAAGTGWGTAELVSDVAGTTQNNQIAVDTNGDAMALWLQFDGTTFSATSNRYRAGTGWGTAELLETDNVNHAANPQVAINPNGNVLAVWIQQDGTRWNIWANRFE